MSDEERKMRTVVLQEAPRPWTADERGNVRDADGLLVLTTTDDGENQLPARAGRILARYIAQIANEL